MSASSNNIKNYSESRFSRFRDCPVENIQTDAWILFMYINSFCRQAKPRAVFRIMRERMTGICPGAAKYLTESNLNNVTNKI